MPLWPQFLGGAYQARSATLDNEACINLMMETIESQENAKRALYAHSDCVFFTCHLNADDETDLDKLELEIIEPEVISIESQEVSP